MKMIRKYMYIAVFYLSNQAFGANIVFDVGDVLVETKYAQTLWSIGPFKLLHCATTGCNPFSAHKRLFALLDAIKPYDQSQIIVKDAHGHIMPQLFIDWLKGTVSGQEILNLVYQAPDSFFTGRAEKNLILALAEVLFTPLYFVETRQIIQPAVALVKDCKKAGHSVYLLSNWEPESFELMEYLYPEVFDLFDGKIISGKVALVKPDPAIYEYLLDTYNLDAHDTILIDDQLENIIAAQHRGIAGIHYTKKQGLLGQYHDFCTVRKKINDFVSSKNLAVSVDENR